jgi:apolipoprotein N-acyltransferase
LIPAVLVIAGGEETGSPITRDFLLGLGFGVLANALVLHWMPIALWRYTPLAAPAYLGAILGLGVYTAIVFVLSGWLIRSTGLSIIIVFPVLWVAMEWLLGHQGILTLPWLGLGTSLTGHPALIQIADVVGARGVTWLLATANSVLAVAWLRRHQTRRAIILSTSVAVGIAIVLTYGIIRTKSLELRDAGRVALIQPNVGYMDKWDPEKGDSIVTAVIALSQRAIVESRPDFVVWPESAIPGYLAYQPVWVKAVARHARESGTPILVGALDVSERDDITSGYYNVAVPFDRLGTRDPLAPYQKRQTVLFVERFGDINAGSESPVFSTTIGDYGVMICYESAFEEVSRQYRRDGAEFIVNISNDAWFGGTLAPYQHEAHVVMRAIENRLAVARAANSGISEIVDPLGQRRYRTAFGETTYVTGALLTSDVLSIYTKLGDWPGLLSLALTMALLTYGAGLAVRRH